MIFGGILPGRFLNGDLFVGKLKKQLGLFEVFSIAAGAMISSGLFILPALAYSKAGPAVIISYLVASILIVPSALSTAELATAMPRAGGAYFFVERSMGAIWGLFSGFSNWFSMALKSAFAIVGMSFLVRELCVVLFGFSIGESYLKLIAVVCCVGFTTLNALSVKSTAKFQMMLAGGLLVILAIFVFAGVPSTAAERYGGFFDKGWVAILATSGLVFISFGGLTNIASISEEVKEPGRNLPLGMMLAWFVVTVFYLAVITVAVGVLEHDALMESFAPISLAAGKTMGVGGFAMLSFAALLAYVTTANGGILAASRCPMAMSRDRLLPGVVAKVSDRFGTPVISIVLTGAFIAAAMVFLELEVLVKTASTLMIILFMLANFSVIMMRESKIQSYRPKFKSPLYPYTHIFAIVIYGVLIIDMGLVPLGITAGFVVLSVGWYYVYVVKNVSRASAAMHIVERVTNKELKTVTLENELRDILLERDGVIEDRFDSLIRDCEIVDIAGRISAEKVFRQISSILAKRLDTDEYVLFEKFLRREKESATVIQPGFAIPHIVLEGQGKFDIVLVRAVEGIDFPVTAEPVKIMFVLAGSRDERNYHLRALMAVAQIAQEKHFEHRWLGARDIEGLRNIILLSARQRDVGSKR